MQASPEECAREVLEVVPLMMRTIRGNLRRHRGQDLSVPQFRVLFYLDRHRGASLSEVSDHVGLTLPSMSTLVDGLVQRSLASRETHASDRRRVTLSLTELGRSTLKSAREASLVDLAKLMRSTSSGDLAVVVRSMRILKPVFMGA